MTRSEEKNATMVQMTKMQCEPKRIGGSTAMEYFYPNASFSPTTSSYFSPTEMYYFQIMMIVMALFSITMHAVFIMSIWRLCGLGASSAYLVLASTAFLGLGFSFNTMLSTLLGFIGMKWLDCVIVWLISGGVFIAAELSMCFIHLYLLLQRITCIFFPMRVNEIICLPVVLICFFMVFLFYAAVITSCLSPYAAAAFIPEHTTYIYLVKSPFTPILSRANQITNYTVTLLNATAYPSLLLFLKFKLKVSRNSKEEMRLTSQVALSVGVEVLFFLLWELCTARGGLQIFIYNVSGLWYYNAVTLPYFIMNKKLHAELKRRIFSQRKCNIEVTVIAPKPSTYLSNANQFQQSFQAHSRFQRLS